MAHISLTHVFMFADPILCFVAILAIKWRDDARSYWFLVTFLAFRVASDIWLNLVFAAAYRFMNPYAAYKVYFYSYWISYTIEAFIGFVMIYGLYNLAMKPLPELQQLGRLMFRWAGGISVALAVGMAMGPHAAGINFVIALVSQIQQTQSVLTLCMLFFVCLAVRPMGLSHRSKIFGVSLGLGTMAAYDLVASSWIAQVNHMASVLSVLGGFAAMSALLIWTAYFAIPEPKRRMIMLPTTSPFLRWNQISAVLNDSPGFVALGEVTEDLFAPAEAEIMHRAARKMTHATV